MKNLLQPQTAVGWLPWSRTAFQRARDERKIILLSVTAAWSHGCREMDEQCYADRSIAHQINTRLIPVRVDADRRPDIADRYDLGGLPTTAFLNADGEILGGGTFVPPERLADALARVSQARVATSTPNLQLPPPKKHQADEESALGVGSWKLGVDDDALIRGVFSHFDHQNGGFCDAPKFPLIAPVRLALELHGETPSDEMLGYVTKTLDAMGWSPLFDSAAGGFYRCASRADWQDPHEEKLLGTNAALLDLYLHAGVATGSERWLARAADVLEYVQSNLSFGPGEGWRLSEQSDGARFSDGNAQMVCAALHASRVFDDGSLRELALQSLESVLLSSYRPGQGVAHAAGGTRGLLTDHVAMISAQLAAWEITGDVVYEMMAEELAHFAIRAFWDEDKGGLFDRDPSSDDSDVALLGRTLKPFVLNCEAAEAFHRLSRATRKQTFARYAALILGAMTPDVPRQGPLAAHYVLARRTLAR